MSQHTIEIIEVTEPRLHDNADSLEIIDVLGWQCCVRKGEFVSGDKAIFVEPDMICSTDRPEFAFLKQGNRTHARISVKKLRGQISQGLLIKVPAELSELPIGTNVIDQLGITRYEPPMKGVSTFGNYVKEPFGLNSPSGLYAPKFDVDSYQRYGRKLFTEGEMVIITEKLHGASARFTWAKNPETKEHEQYCGSRTNWMGNDWRPDGVKNAWWSALHQNPGIGDWCIANPSLVLYGEVFGNVQSLKYGATKDNIFFAAFACMGQNREWIDWDKWTISANAHNVPTVPVLYRGPFVEKMAYDLAEQDSSWPGANHMREGVVILPEHERTDPRLGRVCLKIVSNRYLEKGEK